MSTQLELDIQSYAQILTDYNEQFVAIDKRLNMVELNNAIRAAEDKHVDERFDRIEKRLDNIASLGRWILSAFGSSIVATVAAFYAAGGFHLG